MMATTLLHRITAWGPVLLTALLAGCAVPQAQEIQMGRDAAPQFEKEFGGPYPDRRVQEYVSEVGERLVRYSGRTDLPWQFTVLNSDEVNAFALPGGHVYITKKLLFSLENEAQLAAILAHETAHVGKRHSAKQLERAQVIQGGSTLAGVLSGSGTVGQLSGVAAGLVMMRYSRDQEREADLVGLDYLAKAGYDTSAMLDAMQTIRRLSGKGGPPEFLSTHPSPDDREEYLAAAIQEKYSNIISAERQAPLPFRENVLDRR